MRGETRVVSMMVMVSLLGEKETIMDRLEGKATNMGQF